MVSGVKKVAMWEISVITEPIATWALWEKVIVLLLFIWCSFLILMAAFNRGDEGKRERPDSVTKIDE